MKRLYLVRHAKSSWNHPELDDIDRPLNKRGKRDAPFMGQRLKKHGICPVCKKPLTLGVLYRVQSLADRWEGEKPQKHHSY